MEFGRERYLKQLLEREHNGLIKVITGMRRSGKSFLMNELFYRALIKKGVSDGQIIRFAFDMDEDIDLLEDYFPDEPTHTRYRTILSAAGRSSVVGRLHGHIEWFPQTSESGCLCDGIQFPVFIFGYCYRI